MEQNKSRSVKQNEELVIKAPDGGYSWVVLVASFFIRFIIIGFMYVSFAKIKFEKEKQDSHDFLLNELNTAFVYCSGPLVAALVNRLGCRIVIICGGLMTASMYTLSIFVPNVYVVVTSYGVIGGISTGCTYIASLIAVAKYFDKKRGIATGITMSGGIISLFVCPPLIDYLIKNYNWELTFSICAGLILHTVVCGVLIRPIKPAPVSELKELETKDWNKLGFILILFSNFFVYLVVPFFYINEIIIKYSIVIDLIKYKILVEFLAYIFFGFMADRPFISAINLNTFSIAIATSALVFFFKLSTAIWSSIIFVILLTIGITGVNCLTTMYLVDLVGMKKFTNAIGIMYLFRGLGCFIRPLTSGFFLSEYGKNECFNFYSICFGVAFILSTFVSLLSMICPPKNDEIKRTADESERNLLKV